MFRQSGFTLIELLVVVAVISILAAIAVPNFLEAMVRAKVSRARADLRTIATGLESYAVDANRYPLNDGVYNTVPKELTTPVAYLSSSKLVDPFSDKERDPVFGELARYYTYTFIVRATDIVPHHEIGHTPPNEAVDDPLYNLGARGRYGPWRLVSNGPDRRYNIPGAPIGPWNENLTLKGADIPYDPTNGTVSQGNLLRTQKTGEGTMPE